MRRGRCPRSSAAAPAGLELKLDFDQSVFVRAAVQNVIRERSSRRSWCPR
jgi:hypothetical protein